MRSAEVNVTVGVVHCEATRSLPLAVLTLLRRAWRRAARVLRVRDC